MTNAFKVCYTLTVMYTHTHTHTHTHMQKSQHLTNLGRTDHDFIRQVEGLSYPQVPSHSQSLPALQHRRSPMPQTCTCTIARQLGDLELAERCSNTSSGYGTANSTGRQSVTSILSRDQSLSDLPPVDPLNSLQVGSRSRRISSPDRNISDRRMNLVNQQSQSLTSLPEYSVDIDERNETPNRTYHNYVKGKKHDAAMSGDYQPSLQRQDTGHYTKLVFSGHLESSVDGEQYQAMMGSKRKRPDKQKPLEEPAGEDSSSRKVCVCMREREIVCVCVCVWGGGGGNM